MTHEIQNSNLGEDVDELAKSLTFSLCKIQTDGYLGDRAAQT